MPLFKKSQKKDDRTVDNTTAGRNDPRSSDPGTTDPNFMGYNQPGANSGPGSGYNSSQQPHPNEVGGHPDPHSKPSKLSGKVESAIGNLIGSDTLRAKGIQKEREARSLNMQSNELAQAESLEREAQMHRDRAMGGVEGQQQSHEQRR